MEFVELDKDVFAELAALADDEGMSVSAFIRKKVNDLHKVESHQTPFEGSDRT